MFLHSVKYARAWNIMYSQERVLKMFRLSANLLSLCLRKTIPSRNFCKRMRLLQFFLNFARNDALSYCVLKIVSRDVQANLPLFGSRSLFAQPPAVNAY